MSWDELKRRSQAYADQGVHDLLRELFELADRSGNAHAAAVFEAIEPTLREALRRAHSEGVRDALAG